jgi:hypothetical protein
MAKISKDMTFNEVLRKYPDSVKVLKKYELFRMPWRGG